MNYPEDYINKIICGDCLEVMKGIPDGYVDLIITSPPYNLGNDHHIQTTKGRRTFTPYKDDYPETEYQESQILFLDECFRVLKDDGSMFYNHKNRIKDGFSIIPHCWIFKSKMKVKQELVWFNRSQNFDKIRFYPMTERVYWLSKQKQTKFHNSISHHDLFEWKAEGTDKEHKRSFPISMVTDILKCFPKESIVLDPYCGSGTVLKASSELGMKAFGIELNPEYCEIAQRRLAREYLFN